MNKFVNGIGRIKRGIYGNVYTNGIVFSANDIIVKKLDINGILSGKTIKLEDEFTVNGVVRGDIRFNNKNRIAMICGYITIQKLENDHIILNGDGEIHADTITMDIFNMKGRCRIKRLEAQEVDILEADSMRSIRKQISVIDEICCKRLKAYGLTAENVVADDVELYGACKIGTLTCKEKKYISPDCIIEVEKQMCF